MNDTISSFTIGSSTERVQLKRFGDGTIEFRPLLVVSGTTTSGSAVIASVASTNGVVAGMPISGTGIPSGATVVSVVANTSITISANATASATVTITVDKWNPTASRVQPGESNPEFVVNLFNALDAVN